MKKKFSLENKTASIQRLKEAASYVIITYNRTTKRAFTEVSNLNEGQAIHVLRHNIMFNNGLSKKQATELIINFLNKD